MIGLVYTHMPLTSNILQYIWKLATIMPISNPNKNNNLVTSDIPNLLLCISQNTWEDSIPHIAIQHGYNSLLPQNYTT